MPNPFPGMDPYLESHWGDVHASLIIYARDQLQPLLPSALRARVEERVYVESPKGSRRKLIPDLRIVERPRGKGKTMKHAAAVSLAEPELITLDDPITEGFIEIRDAQADNRLVTVVEVLSLANKMPGAGQELYLKKKRALQASEVNFVEIDLLRGGKRPWPLTRRAPYQVCVHWSWEPTLVAYYPISLRQRLPAIRIPLRLSDEDVPLDLQALVEQAYRNGLYEDDIDYQTDPEPPLSAADAR
jgi:hypothetical protein